MALTADQITILRKKLIEQQKELTDVLTSLKAQDPALSPDRVNDNADIGTDASEDVALVEFESLEQKTQILLTRTTDALKRMEQGTYGTTDDGEEIPFERLMVDPTVTTVLKSL